MSSLEKRASDTAVKDKGAPDPATNGKRASDIATKDKTAPAVVPDEKRAFDTLAVDGPVVKLSWSGLARVSMIGTFIILLNVALLHGRHFLFPIVMGVVIGLIIGPLADRIGRYRVPSLVVGVGAALVLIAIGYAAIIFVSPMVAEWVSRAPEIGAQLQTKLKVFQQPFEALKNLINAVSGSGSKGLVTVDVAQDNTVTNIVAIVGPLVTEMLIFVGTLIFFLVGRKRFRSRLVLFFSSRDARLLALRVMNQIEADLLRYFGTVFFINAGLGLVTVLIAYIAGLPSPVLWGALAFVVNYLPYLGPAIVTTVLTVVGLVTFDSVGQALIAPGLFVLATTIEGHFLTPSIIGRRLTLDPFLVFLAIAYWTWLWGPLGAFLATPMLVILIAIESNLFPPDEPVALPE